MNCPKCSNKLRVYNEVMPFTYCDSKGDDVSLRCKIKYRYCDFCKEAYLANTKKAKKRTAKAIAKHESLIRPSPHRSRKELVWNYSFGFLWSCFNFWLQKHFHGHPYRTFFEVFGIMTLVNEAMDFFVYRKKRILKAVNARLDR